MTMTIGIDPGLKGGIAYVLKTGKLFGVRPMPLWKQKIDWEVLSNILHAEYDNQRVFLEIQRPFTMKGKSGRPQIMAGTQTMVENYGVLKYILGTLEIPFVEVDPRTWQAAYRSRKSTRSHSVRNTDIPGLAADKIVAANRQNKTATMQIANGIWPYAAKEFGADWTEGTAEAALIAEWGRINGTGG